MDYKRVLFFFLSVVKMSGNESNFFICSENINEDNVTDLYKSLLLIQNTLLRGEAKSRIRLIHAMFPSYILNRTSVNMYFDKNGGQNDQTEFVQTSTFTGHQKFFAKIPQQSNSIQTSQYKFSTSSPIRQQTGSNIKKREYLQSNNNDYSILDKDCILSSFIVDQNFSKSQRIITSTVAVRNLLTFFPTHSVYERRLVFGVMSNTVPLNAHAPFHLYPGTKFIFKNYRDNGNIVEINENLEVDNKFSPDALGTFTAVTTDDDGDIEGFRWNNIFLNFTADNLSDDVKTYLQSTISQNVDGNLEIYIDPNILDRNDIVLEMLYSDPSGVSPNLPLKLPVVSVNVGLKYRVTLYNMDEVVGIFDFLVLVNKTMQKVNLLPKYLSYKNGLKKSNLFNFETSSEIFSELIHLKSGDFLRCEINTFLSDDLYIISDVGNLKTTSLSTVIADEGGKEVVGIEVNVVAENYTYYVLKPNDMSFNDVSIQNSISNLQIRFVDDSFELDSLQFLTSSKYAFGFKIS